MQGDSNIAEIYKVFGVKTIYTEKKIKLEKVKSNMDKFSYNLTSNPDLAQTICITCLGLGYSCHLTGLHTLKIKETDRIEALKKEFIKLGVDGITTSDNKIYFKGNQKLNNNTKINTYQDHRMALSFAPLAVIIDISIESPNVVSKSFPDYWEDLKTLGFKIN